MSTETETENKTNDVNTQKNYFLRFYSKIKKWLSQIFNINRKYIKLFCRFSSVICSIVSIIILWSELVMAFQWKSPVGYLMGAYSPQREKNAVVMQAVSFLALSYMSICTYWSLFRLNLGWAYSLQGPQLSPPASLIFNGEYFSRLQFALGYNFLTFLSIPRYVQFFLYFHTCSCFCICSHFCFLRIRSHLLLMLYFDILRISCQY